MDLLPPFTGGSRDHTALCFLSAIIRTSPRAAEEEEEAEPSLQRKMWKELFESSMELPNTVWSSKHWAVRASIDQISWEKHWYGSMDRWCLVKKKPLTSCSHCTERRGRWRGGRGGRGRRPVLMRGTTTRWPPWQPWTLRETGGGRGGSKEVSHVVHWRRGPTARHTCAGLWLKKDFSGYLLTRSYTCFNLDWSRERRPPWSGRVIKVNQVPTAPPPSVSWYGSLCTVLCAACRGQRISSLLPRCARHSCTNQTSDLSRSSTGVIYSAPSRILCKTDSGLFFNQWKLLGDAVCWTKNRMQLHRLLF